MSEEERVMLHEHIRAEARKLIAKAKRESFEHAAVIAEGRWPTDQTLVTVYRQLAKESYSPTPSSA